MGTPLRPWSRRALLAIYSRLRRHNGPAGWWPAETPFEVCLGAILTQNTAWTNVEKALEQLRRRNLLSYEALRGCSASEIAPLIRPAGYFNVKARRVCAFLDFVGRELGGRVEHMRREAPVPLRERLLAVPGIGRETADSIALYAAGHALFVVDAYTRRVFSRLGLLGGGEPYDEIAERFMRHLPRDAGLFNDYHAQIVLLGKDRCRTRPRCDACPLGRRCERRGVGGPRRRTRRTPGRVAG